MESVQPSLNNLFYCLTVLMVKIYINSSLEPVWTTIVSLSDCYLLSSCLSLCKAWFHTLSQLLTGTGRLLAGPHKALSSPEHRSTDSWASAHFPDHLGYFLAELAPLYVFVINGPQNWEILMYSTFSPETTDKQSCFFHWVDPPFQDLLDLTLGARDTNV